MTDGRLSSARAFPGLRWLGAAIAVAVAVAVLVRPAGAPPSEPTVGAVVIRDPANGFSWAFDACWSLGSEHEVIEQKVIGGDGQATIRKLPAELRFLDLECSRSLTDDTSLWSWRAEVERGDMTPARRDVELQLLDAAGDAVDAWNVGAAWPSRLEAAVDANAAFERVRWVMESVVRVGVPSPTPTPAPTSTPTPTPTPTPTSTPIVPTPTPTPIPPENVVFRDGFESSDTSAWTDVLDPG